MSNPASPTAFLSAATVADEAASASAYAGRLPEIDPSITTASGAALAVPTPLTVRVLSMVA